jgi:SAM-dependent methyltransferase
VRAQLHERATAALLYAAAKLRVPDAVAGGPLASGEIAGRVGMRPELAHRALRAMAAVDVLEERDDGRFGLGELGACLVSGAPGSVRGELIAEYEMFRAWDELPEALRTGETAFERAFGATIWAQQAADPDVAAYHAAMMSQGAEHTAGAIARAVDFGRLGEVVDVGGGRGAVLAEVLRAHPRASGVLFDRPHVVARPLPAIEALARAGRCRVVGGDFFEAVPEGDCLLLRIVLHDWDDAAAARLLASCRRALRPGGRLIAAEKVMPARVREAPNVVLSDAMMMVHTGGRERTVEELRGLFAGAGLELVQVGTAGHLAVLECAPA